MTKSTRKKIKGTRLVKGAKGAERVRKTAKSQTKAAEYVGSLLELHKLQGTLLGQLRREI